MPKLSKNLTELLTRQIHLELHSHLSYLSLAAFFERGAFKGFAHRMRTQAAEEHAHAMKFFDYLVARGADVLLDGIDAPKTEFKTPLEVFKYALGREQAVTKAIHTLYDVALKEKDFATLEMLNWFLKEQVEEEESTGEMVDRVSLAGSDTASLLQLDHEAGERK